MACGALAAAGCSSGGGAEPGGVEEFCEQVRNYVREMRDDDEISRDAFALAARLEAATGEQVRVACGKDVEEMLQLHHQILDPYNLHD